jgi:uncharacterized protein (TIRG00374 family)
MPQTPSTSIENTETPPSVNSSPDELPSIPVWHAVGAVLLSVGVLALIAYLTFDASVFWAYAGRANAGWLALAVAAVAARVAFGGWRLSYISGGRISFEGGLRGQLAWDFFSNITPSAIGGAPLATFYVARDVDLRIGETTALMLFSMLLDQLWFAVTIPALLLATVWMPVFPEAAGWIGQWVLATFFVGMLGWTVLFAYATLVRIDVLEKAAHWLTSFRWLRRFQGRVDREMTQLRRRATMLRGQPLRFFVNGFLMTVGAWISRYLSLVFVVWSVYTELDKLLLIFRSAGLMLLALALPTPGGSGGIEGLYALFIGPLIPQAVMAPTLVTWRVLAYYLFIAGGAYLTIYQVQKTLRDRKHKADSERCAPSPDGQPREAAEADERQAVAD